MYRSRQVTYKVLRCKVTFHHWKLVFVVSKGNRFSHSVQEKQQLSCHTLQLLFKPQGYLPPTWQTPGEELWLWLTQIRKIRVSEWLCTASPKYMLLLQDNVQMITNSLIPTITPVAQLFLINISFFFFFNLLISFETIGNHQHPLGGLHLCCALLQLRQQRAVESNWGILQSCAHSLLITMCRTPIQKWACHLKLSLSNKGGSVSYLSLGVCFRNTVVSLNSALMPKNVKLLGISALLLT